MAKEILQLHLTSPQNNIFCFKFHILIYSPLILEGWRGATVELNGWNWNTVIIYIYIYIYIFTRGILKRVGGGMSTLTVEWLFPWMKKRAPLPVFPREKEKRNHTNTHARWTYKYKENSFLNKHNYMCKQDLYVRIDNTTDT